MTLIFWAWVNVKDYWPARTKLPKYSQCFLQMEFFSGMGVLNISFSTLSCANQCMEQVLWEHPVLHINLLTYVISVFEKFHLNCFNLFPSPAIYFNIFIFFFIHLPHGGQNQSFKAAMWSAWALSNIHQAAGWNAPSPFVDLKGILVPENFSLEFEKFTTSVILQFSNQFLPHTFLGPRIAGAWLLPRYVLILCSCTAVSAYPLLFPEH